MTVNENPVDMVKTLDIIKGLYDYFDNDLEKAIEAFLEGYTVDQLKAFGDFDPQLVYLIWVKPYC